MTWKAIAPAPTQIDVMRAIANSGFDRAAAKRLCSAAGWQLCCDEPELGFEQWFWWLGNRVADRRLLSLGTREMQGSPHLYLPLFYFGEEGGDPAEANRAPFDDAYFTLAERISVTLGLPGQTGTYEHSHRTGWTYKYCEWRLHDAHVMLLQDEHDIQFGMDISLWFFAPDSGMSAPLPF